MISAIIVDSPATLATRMEITPGTTLPPLLQAQLQLQLQPPSVGAEPAPPLPANGVIGVVVASRGPVAPEGSYRLQIEVGGERLEVSSKLPLSSGTRLLLEALTPTRLRAQVAPLEVSSGEAIRTVLRREMPLQLPLRESMDALRKSVMQLPSGEPLRREIQQLLQRIPSPEQVQNPQGLQQALRHSGVFLEPRLAQTLQQPSRATLAPERPPGQTSAAGTRESPSPGTSTAALGQQFAGGLRSLQRLLGSIVAATAQRAAPDSNPTLAPASAAASGAPGSTYNAKGAMPATGTIGASITTPAPAVPLTAATVATNQMAGLIEPPATRATQVTQVTPNVTAPGIAMSTPGTVMTPPGAGAGASPHPPASGGSGPATAPGTIASTANTQTAVTRVGQIDVAGSQPPTTPPAAQILAQGTHTASTQGISARGNSLPPAPSSHSAAALQGLAPAFAGATAVPGTSPPQTTTSAPTATSSTAATRNAPAAKLAADRTARTMAASVSHLLPAGSSNASAIGGADAGIPATAPAVGAAGASVARPAQAGVDHPAATRAPTQGGTDRASVAVATTAGTTLAAQPRTGLLSAQSSRGEPMVPAAAASQALASVPVPVTRMAPNHPLTTPETSAVQLTQSSAAAPDVVSRVVSQPGAAALNPAQPQPDSAPRALSPSTRSGTDNAVRTSTGSEPGRVLPGAGASTASAAPAVAASTMPAAAPAPQSTPNRVPAASTGSIANAPQQGLEGQARAIADIADTDTKAQLLRLLHTLTAALPGARGASAASRGPAPSGNGRESLYSASGMRIEDNAATHAALALPVGSQAQLRALRSARDDAGARTSNDVVEVLLRYVLGALARTRVHQLSSHGDSRQQSDPAALPSWSLELPLFNGNRHDALELRIAQREPEGSNGDTLQRTWEVMLRLDIEGLGALHATLQLQGMTLAATLWAERSTTLQLARKHLHELAEQLGASGIELRRLECRSGEPEAQPGTRLDRLVDVTT